jgi:hypothetical protein
MIRTGEVVLGDVVVLIGPDGSRKRYMVSTLSMGPGKVVYELSDHADSDFYDTLLTERTVLTLTVLK